MLVLLDVWITIWIWTNEYTTTKEFIVYIKGKNQFYSTAVKAKIDVIEFEIFDFLSQSCYFSHQKKNLIEAYIRVKSKDMSEVNRVLFNM